MFACTLLVSGLLASFVSATPIVPRNISSIKTYDTFLFEGDVPWPATPEAMGSILSCPYGTVDSNSKPVLMVHGTGSDGKESWNLMYGPELKKAGYEPCWVDLRK